MDRGYAFMKQLFGERLVQFHEAVDAARRKCGIRGKGGDPDLFVQSRRNPQDRFFVEVKMEYRHHSGRRFKDSLNDQQLVVFPLINSVLECPVRIAKVYVFRD